MSATKWLFPSSRLQCLFIRQFAHYSIPPSQTVSNAIAYSPFSLVYSPFLLPVLAGDCHTAVPPFVGLFAQRCEPDVPLRLLKTLSLISLRLEPNKLDGAWVLRRSVRCACFVVRITDPHLTSLLRKNVLFDTTLLVPMTAA